MKKLFTLSIIAISIWSCSSQKESADLIVKNAIIWTANPNQPSASAMAIREGKILAISDDVDEYLGTDTEVIDAEGYFITPGFIDTHVHFITGGQNLSSVQLRDAATKEEFISRIGEFAKTQEPGTWIIGGDWDHKLWGGELPQKEWIDSVTRQNPIYLNRLDGHMALVNSLILKESGIDGSTTVDEGEIILNNQGEPTGILKEGAMRIPNSIFPEITDKQYETFAVAAMNYVASHGVTSVHDMNGFGDQAVFARLNKRGELNPHLQQYTTPLLAEIAGKN